MTHANPDAFERLGLRFECGYCHASIGDWCISKSGKPTQFLHSARHHEAVEWRRREAKRRGL